MERSRLVRTVARGSAASIRSVETHLLSAGFLVLCGAAHDMMSEKSWSKRPAHEHPSDIQSL